MNTRKNTHKIILKKMCSVLTFGEPSIEEKKIFEIYRNKMSKEFGNTLPTMLGFLSLFIFIVFLLCTKVSHILIVIIAFILMTILIKKLLTEERDIEVFYDKDLTVNNEYISIVAVSNNIFNFFKKIIVKVNNEYYILPFRKATLLTQFNSASKLIVVHSNKNKRFVLTLVR